MIYLLYYDTDYGSREEWNTFYTPVEAFRTPADRDARKAFLKNSVDQDGEPLEYEFHEVNIEFLDDPHAPVCNDNDDGPRDIEAITMDTLAMLDLMSEASGQG